MERNSDKLQTNYRVKEAFKIREFSILSHGITELLDSVHRTIFYGTQSFSKTVSF
jgi:hypothetical protein